MRTRPAVHNEHMPRCSLPGFAGGFAGGLAGDLAGGLALLLCFTSCTTPPSQPERSHAGLGSLRHVVLFKFKDGTTKEQLKAVEDAFRELAARRAAVQARQRTAAGPTKLSTMGAVLASQGVAGAKVYTTIDGRFRFVVLLFSASSGAPLAVIEADAFTELRTAAVTAVAARRLAPQGAGVLALFGTGVQARAHAVGLAETLSLSAVRVVSRGDAATFCRDLAARIDAEITQAPAPAALDGADLVVTATRAASPLFDGALLAPGTFVAAVGSTLPHNRELDDVTIERSRRVVVEWLPQARLEAGDLIGAAAAGCLDWDDVVELGAVLAGTAPGRLDAGDIIVFESVGIGLEDVAVAAAVYAQARASGMA